MSLLLLLDHAAGSAVSVFPGVGALTITGYAPTVSQPQTINPGVGSITLTGYAPTVTQPQTVSPSAGSVTLIGYAPTVTQSATVATTTQGGGHPGSRPAGQSSGHAAARHDNAHDLIFNDRPENFSQRSWMAVTELLLAIANSELMEE